MEIESDNQKVATLGAEQNRIMYAFKLRNTNLKYINSSYVRRF